MKKKNRGYIMILLTAFVPVILLGTKLILDLNSSHMTDSVKPYKIFKRCAPECALEVAKHWNLGLNLKQQKEALLRVADEVYNNAITYTDMAYKYEAIPGIDVTSQIGVSKGGVYDPLQVKVISSITSEQLATSRNIAYKQVESPWGRVIIGSTRYRALRTLVAWNTIFKYERIPALVLEDSVQYMLCHDASNDTHNYDRSYTRLDSFRKMMNDPTSQGWASGKDPNLSHTRYATQNYYTVRDNPEDGDNKLQISVENDKIKVTIDSDTIQSSAYAVPAECNVDIVLGVPNNEAAHNRNNYDQRTPTQGGYENIGDNFINDNAKATPIMQIGQELHDFVKNNFYFTRGVNVGIIPYSGQCAVDPDRMDSWTTPPPHFIINNYSGVDGSEYINQNTYLNYVRQCFMYSAWRPNVALNAIHDNDYGITSYSGTNIYARRGKTETSSECGGNTICCGDLLSTVAPTSDNQQFLQFSSQIIKGTACNANLLTGKWENPTYYWSTFCPFYIIELQSDLQRVTDMLNCLCPFPRYKHINGTSNFIFIPVTWANNLFQEWTNNPTYNATNTTDDFDGLGRLSQPSKTTENRKKAVIIVVNKPDWFEPGEITYLGYDNDFSEIPLVESDTIRFDTDYSDTDKKFADGTSFDGTIQGQKKILKFTSSDNKITYNTRSGNIGHGYYETTSTVNDSSSDTGTLTFPKKYLLKIVVEPIPTWKNVTTSGLSYNTNHYCMGRVGVGPVSDSSGNIQNRMLMVYITGALYYSNDGTTWTQNSSVNTPTSTGNTSNWFLGPVYGNGVWNVFCHSKGHRVTSADGKNWTIQEASSAIGTQMSIAFGEGIFMAPGADGGTYTSTNALSFTQVNSTITPARCLGYGRNMWLCTDENQNVYKSTDSGANWTSCTTNLNTLFSCSSNEWYGFAYAYGYFYAINHSSEKIIRSKDGEHWELCYMLNSAGYRNITLFNNKLYSFHQSNNSSYIGDLYGIINFTDIASKTNRLQPNTDYAVKERTEFYIEPDQIQTGSDGNYSVTFAMKSIRLISAEITNRPYERVDPSCSISGTTNGTGIATITTSVKKPMTLKASTVDSKVQFYNSNGVVENTSEYILTGPQTFTFAGSNNLKNLENNQKALGNFSTTGGKNFGHNFSTKKLKYSLINAKIASATLRNQALRCCGHYYYVKEKGVNYNQEGTVQRIVPNTIVRSEWRNGNSKKNSIQYIDPCLCPIDDHYSASATSYNDLAHGGWEWANWSGDQVANLYANNFHIKCYGVQSCKYISVNDWIPTNAGGDTNYTIHVQSNQWLSINVALNATAMNGNKYFVAVINLQSLGYTLFDSNCIELFTGRLTNNGNQYRYLLNTFYFLNTGVVTYKGAINSETDNNLIQNKGIYSLSDNTGNWLCFCGDGDLEVTVESPTTIITHTDALGKTVTNKYTTEQTIRIDPENYKYEEQSDGTYKITLQIDGIKLSDLKYDYSFKKSNNDVVYEAPKFTVKYTNLPMPQMSRVVDVYQKGSDNAFVYNIAGEEREYEADRFMYCKNVDGTIPNGTQWYNNRWTIYRDRSASGIDSTWHTLLDPESMGDFFMITEDEGEINNGTTYIRLNGGSNYYYIGSGLCRLNYANCFSPSWKTNTGYSGGGIYTYWFEAYNMSSLYIPYAMLGETLSVNNFLYWGASVDESGNKLLHKYQWQSDANGKLTTRSATEAVKNLTVDACKKLKADWGANIRMYLIKYRKQESYKHPATQASTNFDYNYLSECASGTEAPYIYDISTQDELKSALSDIAADIKTWAVYTPARNVE